MKRKGRYYNLRSRYRTNFSWAFSQLRNFNNDIEGKSFIFAFVLWSCISYYKGKNALGIQIRYRTYCVKKIDKTSTACNRLFCFWMNCYWQQYLSWSGKQCYTEALRCLRYIFWIIDFLFASECRIRFPKWLKNVFENYFCRKYLVPVVFSSRTGNQSWHKIWSWYFLTLVLLLTSLAAVCNSTFPFPQVSQLK